MAPSGLVSLPAKLLLHICSFLAEDSLTSLSQTCSWLHSSLNDDAVWERFVPQQVRSLKSLTRRLKPHHHWGLCKNRQHLLRRNQLISNWKRGRYKQYSKTYDCRIDIEEVQFYKEKYMFMKTDQGIQFCDISKALVFYPTRIKQKSQSEFGVRLFLIEDYLVVADSCVVNVYRIDVSNKEFPFLYSFAIKDVKVVGGCVFLEDKCVQKQDWEYKTEHEFLLCTQTSSVDKFPVLHIWNIITGVKVGTFKTPVAGNILVFESFVDNTLLLQIKRGPVAFYFKFCLETKTFSNTLFRLPFIFEHMTVRLLTKDCCIKFMRPSNKILLCETVDLSTSNLIAGRWFRNVHYVTDPTIVDGRFVVVYPISFFVVDATSLETMFVVPHSPNEAYASFCPVSVYGSTYLLAILKVGSIKVWDVDRKQCTLASEGKLRNKLGKLLPSSKASSLCKIYGNLSTKIVSFRNRKITVIHFW